MAERVFARKLEKVGFVDMAFRTRQSFGIDECAVMPLLVPHLIALMRRLIPEDRWPRVAMSVIVTARKPRA